MSETLGTFSNIVARGNTFMMRWGLIVLFVQFTVVVPYFDPVKNDRIGRTQKIIDMQINDYQKLLSSKDQSSKLDRYKIREKIISLQKSYLELESKKKTRGFSIPFLEIQIDKNAILLFYPSLVFGGLIWILRLRSKLITFAIKSPPLPVPIWAAPFPYKLFNGHFISWILSNVAAITCHVIFIAWVLDFFWKVRNAIRYEFLAVFLLILLTLAFHYMVSIWTIINCDFQETFVE